MIGTIDTKVQSHSPDFPLETLKSFVGSPSSIRVRNVPKRIGNWNITNVFVTVVYPDNTTRTIESLLTGGVYVATMEGCNVSGKVENGLTITANGKDENDNLVTGYVLGKGDVEILSAMENVSPGQTVYYIHLLEDEPDVPKNGDMYKKDGNYVVYQNGVETPLGVSQENMESYVDRKIEEAVEELEASISNVDEKVDSAKTELEGDITELQESKADASDLELKQDKLSDDQLSAVDQSLYELQTKIRFSDNTSIYFVSRSFSLTRAILKEKGILDEAGTTWLKEPIKIETGSNVSSIDTGLFQNATMLQIFIGTNISQIWGQGFSGCTSLSKVEIPSVESIMGSNLFSGCTSLTNLTLPKTLRSVARMAFNNTSLQKVVFEGKTLAQVKAMTNYSRWGLTEDKIYTNAFENQLPTKTSDLTNDSGFITATALTPYREKSDLYYEHSFNKTNWQNVPRFIMDYDGTQTIFDKFDSTLDRWTVSTGTSDWYVQLTFVGMEADPQFMLMKLEDGITDILPTEGAGTTTVTFIDMGIEGTFTMDMSDELVSKLYVDRQLTTLEARIAALENNA